MTSMRHVNPCLYCSSGRQPVPTERLSICLTPAGLRERRHRSREPRSCRSVKALASRQRPGRCSPVERPISQSRTLSGMRPALHAPSAVGHSLGFMKASLYIVGGVVEPSGLLLVASPDLGPRGIEVQRLGASSPAASQESSSTARPRQAASIRTPTARHRFVPVERVCVGDGYNVAQAVEEKVEFCYAVTSRQRTT